MSDWGQAVKVEPQQYKENVLYWGITPWTLSIRNEQGLHSVHVYGDPAALGGERKVDLAGAQQWVVVRGYKIVVYTHEDPAIIWVTPGPR